METKKDTAVVKTDSPLPINLIALALEQKAPAEQLEKLLVLQERFEKTQAEKAFNLAMTKFQKECPVIEKRKIVKDKHGKERYRYAPIGDIIRQVKTLLAKHKLYYAFTKEDSEGFLTAICTVTHEIGHSKQSSFKVPIGKEDYMTDVQKYGARRTFANRYAFCDVFGITTADADIDGQEPEEKLDKTEISANILLKYKTEIDKCLKHSDLLKNYISVIGKAKKEGINGKHGKELRDYINKLSFKLKGSEKDTKQTSTSTKSQDGEKSSDNQSKSEISDETIQAQFPDMPETDKTAKLP